MKKLLCMLLIFAGCMCNPLNSVISKVEKEGKASSVNWCTSELLGYHFVTFAGISTKCLTYEDAQVLRVIHVFNEIRTSKWEGDKLTENVIKGKMVVLGRMGKKNGKYILMTFYLMDPSGNFKSGATGRGCASDARVLTITEAQAGFDIEKEYWMQKFK